METRIVSVTVSRNGRALLSDHLELLLNQSVPLLDIIVVDNASDDSTVEFLRERYPSVRVIPLANNQGASGGYSVGLQYALGCNYEWVWMLDQDSRPPHDTLRSLLAAYNTFPEREKLGLIAPLPINPTTGAPYSLFVWRDGQVKLSTTAEGRGITLVDMVISSGSLIRNEAIVKAGLPRADFFMDFADYEHCLRLRRSGFLIAVVNNCHMPHTVGQPRVVNFLGRPINWITHRPWRDYYKVRNRAFVVWYQLPSRKAKTFVIYQLLKQMIGTLLYDPEKLDHIRFMWRGLCDGIRGRLGITVQPTE